MKNNKTALDKCHRQSDCLTHANSCKNFNWSKFKSAADDSYEIESNNYVLAEKGKVEGCPGTTCV